jgi:hypothetical protein
MLVNQAIRRDGRWKRIVPGGGRTIPPADVQHDGGKAPTNGILGPHAIAPEAVGDASLDSVRFNPRPAARRIRHAHQLDLVPLKIEARVFKHAFEEQPPGDPRR